MMDTAQSRFREECLPLRLHFHLLTLSGDSTIGGMETSVRRIASHLAGSLNNCTIYTRLPLYSDPEPRIGFQEIGPEAEHLLEPFRSVPIFDVAERARMHGLVFRAHIEEAIRRYPEHRHVVVSFFISGAGFIAQQVGDALGLRHIACIRGSDFSKDCHSPHGFAAAQYVAERAFYVVTTNRSQDTWVRTILRRAERLITIYNSAPTTVINSPRWAPRRRDHIRLIADCGLSHKKATHVLFEAIESVLFPAPELQFDIAGPVEPSQEAYWAGLVAHYEGRFAGRFRFLGQLAQESLLDRLLDSDIYCSASLGEGCSNGAIKALVLGMPIVATRTGALKDIANNVSHVELVPPASLASIKAALAKKIEEVRRGTLMVEESAIQRWRAMLTVDREHEAWESIAAEVRDSPLGNSSQAIME